MNIRYSSVLKKYDGKELQFKCGIGILVVSQPSKLVKGVRFSYPAPRSTAVELEELFESDEEMLSRYDRQMRSINHRLQFWEDQWNDLQRSPHIFPLWRAPASGIPTQNQKVFSTNDPSKFVVVVDEINHPELVTALTNILAMKETLIAKKAATIRRRNAAAHKSSKVKQATKITSTIANIPPTIDLPYQTRLRGQSFISTKNPYLEFSHFQFAGDPDEYHWKGDVIHYTKLKILLHKYGLKFDVVYVSRDADPTKPAAFAAIAQSPKGPLVWYRSGTEGKSSRVYMPTFWRSANVKSLTKWPDSWDHAFKALFNNP